MIVIISTIVAELPLGVASSAFVMLHEPSRRTFQDGVQ